MISSGCRRETTDAGPPITKLKGGGETRSTPKSRSWVKWSLIAISQTVPRELDRYDSLLSSFKNDGVAKCGNTASARTLQLWVDLWSKSLLLLQSKGGILSKACRYIADIRDSNAQLSKRLAAVNKEVEQLKRENENLREENSSLRAQLNIDTKVMELWDEEPASWPADPGDPEVDPLEVEPDRDENSPPIRDTIDQRLASIGVDHEYL